MPPTLESISVGTVIEVLSIIAFLGVTYGRFLGLKGEVAVLRGDNKTQWRRISDLADRLARLEGRG